MNDFQCTGKNSPDGIHAFCNMTDKLLSGIFRCYRLSTPPRLEWSGGGFCELLGYSPDELSAIEYNSIFISEADADAFLSALSEPCAPADGRIVHVVLAHKNGSRIAVTEQIRPIPDGEALPCAFVTTIKAEGLEPAADAPDENAKSAAVTSGELSPDTEAEMLRERVRLLGIVAEHSGRNVWVYNARENKVETSPETAKKYRLPEVTNGFFDSLFNTGNVLPESAGAFKDLMSAVFSGHDEAAAKIHVKLPDSDTSCWFDMRITAVRNSAGSLNSALCSTLDVTVEHTHALAYEQHRQNIDKIKEAGAAFFEVDVTDDVLELIDGGLLPLKIDIGSSSHSELVEKLLQLYFPSAEHDEARSFFSCRHMLSMFAKGSFYAEREWPLILPDNTGHWVMAELRLMQDPYTRHIKAFIILRDITAQKNAALDMQTLASTDGMTKLLNKAAAEARIRNILSSPQGISCALMIVDLDDFKAINDGFGHDEGDRTLCRVADALRGMFRKTDIIGRFGGDEFIIFLPEIDSEAKLRSIMSLVLRRIAEITVDGDRRIAVSGSLGAAFGMTGTDSFEKLFKDADKALYHVKHNGKQSFAIYTSGMNNSNFEFTTSSSITLRNTDVFETNEFNRFIDAISTIFPLVFSVNLTRNNYYSLEYSDFSTKAASEAGNFDELIEVGAMTFHPDDRQSFIDAFSRSSLLDAQRRGEKRIHHTGRQLGDDGVYRLIETNVVFTAPDKSGDICEITLARPLE